MQGFSSVFPCDYKGNDGVSKHFKGIPARETAAMMIMQGLVASSTDSSLEDLQSNAHRYAETAFTLADALFDVSEATRYNSYNESHKDSFNNSGSCQNTND